MKQNRRLLFAIILFAATLFLIPTKVLAANRPAGFEFVDGGFKYKVITAGSETSVGTVQLMGMAGAETTLGVSDTIFVIDENEVYESEYFIVASIAPSAFKGNKNLTDVMFHDNSHITTIPKNCFANCTNITSISMYNVKTISSGAFSGCKRLTTVTVLDDSLKKVDKNAFKNCKKLDHFSIWDSTLKTVGKNAFKGTRKGLTIYTKYKKNFTKIKKSGGAKGLRFVDMN